LGLETLLVLSHDGDANDNATSWSRQPSIAQLAAWGNSQHELSTFGASVDLARGLPIVHVSYGGFGLNRLAPTATGHGAVKCARWIELLRRLWGAARRSLRREYDVWIYVWV